MRNPIYPTVEILTCENGFGIRFDSKNSEFGNEGKHFVAKDKAELLDLIAKHIPEPAGK